MDAKFHILSSVLCTTILCNIAYSWGSRDQATVIYPNPELQTSDRFGISVDIDGSTVVIGASHIDLNGALDAGNAYIFNTRGELVFSIPNPDPEEEDFFGSSVAIDDSTVIIGAMGDNSNKSGTSGSVYVFNTSGHTLTKIPNPEPYGGGSFGKPVALNRSTFVVGERYDSSNGARYSGSAYVFDTNGKLLTVLPNPNPRAEQGFGLSADISASTVVVGTEFDSLNNGGQVYVFNTAGKLLTTLLNPNPLGLDRFGKFEQSDDFGISVAVDNSIIVIGSPYNDFNNVNDSGSVYVFYTNGQLLATISSPFPKVGELFGFSIALDGSIIVVGTLGSDLNELQTTCTAYVFDTSGQFLAKLSNPDPENFNQFGYSVAISGSNIIVGAPDSISDSTFSSGRAYLFDTSGQLLMTFPNLVNNGDAE